MRLASFGSPVSSRSRAGRGFLILPMELSLGPSLHPRSSSSSSPRTPATLTSAWIPGLAMPPESPRLMCLRPIIASARLSPTRGAMSTTVPTETRSSRRPSLFFPPEYPSPRAPAPGPPRPPRAPGLAGHGPGELPGHADPGQRVVLVPQLGVEDGDGRVRRVLRRDVVVRHDDLHPELVRQCHLPPVAVPAA